MPRHFAYTVLLLITIPVSARATTIEFLRLEEMVDGADFVGVVEVDTAGGIVARYKVIESLKGPKAGETVAIRLGLNYWGDKFPSVYCGERFFVAAYRSPPSVIISTTSGGPVPLWWRNIPSDFELPLGNGLYGLSGPEGKKREADLIARARDLLSAKPEEREGKLLRLLLDDHLFDRDRWLGGEPDAKKAEELKERLAALKTTSELVDGLLALVHSDPKKWSVRCNIVFERGGREITLGRLQKLDKSPFVLLGTDYLPDTIHSIKSRLTPPKRVARGSAKSPPAATAEELENLLKWEPDTKTERRIERTRGYELGSSFAVRCQKDRVKSFKAMLAAKDPYIQVAGAVYLCFEDETAGKTELKKLMKLPGEPGGWAALTLARRGEKDALPRALDMLQESGSWHADSFRNQIRVLLSNSAKASGLPQPAFERWADERKS